MSLDAEERERFFSIARELGHDVEVLRAGGEQRSQIEINSIERLRAILSRADDETRRRRGASFYDKIQHRQRLLQGRHDRAEAYIFADGEISERDQGFIDRYLPVLVDTLSLEDKVLARNQVWDLGTSVPAVVINLGTLTMEPGSRILISNSVLSFTCQTLIRNRETDGVDVGTVGAIYDLGIFGANPDEVIRLQLDKAKYAPVLNSGTVNAELVGAFVSAQLPLSPGAPVTVLTESVAWRIVDPVAGATYSLLVNQADAAKINVFQLAMQGPAGGKGGKGSKGDKGTCKCSNTEPGDKGGTGGTGGEGGGGGIGQPGRVGLPGLRAEVTIQSSLQGSFVVQTQGGSGGQGGKGGRGGDGGKGGTGGDGAKCTGTCTGGGRGGQGGQAGRGGDGGKGGDGIYATDVYVVVPAANVNQVVPVAQQSRPGPGGLGGNRGTPGEGGDGGSAPSNNICKDGSKGQRGLENQDGAVGTPGDKGGLAGRIIINGVG